MNTNFSEIFYEAERNAMSFMESEYSFRSVDRRVVDEWVFGTATYAEAPTLNKPRDLELFVTLSVAPLRLELDLYIGVGENKKTNYSIYELYRLERVGDFPRRQHNLYEAMHDVQQLQAEFENLTQVLRDCGSRFFAGDKLLWDDLSKQRLSLTKAQDDIRASRNAEKAFTAKQWDQVIILLEPRESRLSKVDTAKLTYARKHREMGT
ncbi:MAG: hypothetical protein HXX11_18060 [Desulfuromonadales bacterium]|nr:hypothetical protein [Desulfuromonadales bacterium]